MTVPYWFLSLAAISALAAGMCGCVGIAVKSWRIYKLGAQVLLLETRRADGGPGQAAADSETGATDFRNASLPAASNARGRSGSEERSSSLGESGAHAGARAVEMLGLAERQRPRRDSRTGETR